MYIHICILYICTHICISILYIYTYTFFGSSGRAASCMMACARLLMFWITFHVPPLVLDLFLAFKLIMLSPSSRAVSWYFWVLYPLRLRRHTSQAFRLDVLSLLARQTPWGLLGWLLNVTSSRYQTSYTLGLFNKHSFWRQIDDLSRCIFWDFGVTLFIHVYWKHLFCERIEGLQLFESNAK